MNARTCVALAGGGRGPVSAWYEFARQSVQPALPGSVLYLPATHAVHAPPSGPEKPATHTQSVAASLPVAVEYVLALQSEQATSPVIDLYLPDTQAIQVPPLGPVKPELQMQLLEDVEPATDCVFAGQVEQSSTYNAPSVFKNVLTGQSVHGALPLIDLNLPAEHRVQVSPFGPV